MAGEAGIKKISKVFFTQTCGWLAVTFTKLGNSGIRIHLVGKEGVSFCSV